MVCLGTCRHQESRERETEQIKREWENVYKRFYTVHIHTVHKSIMNRTVLKQQNEARGFSINYTNQNHSLMRRPNEYVQQSRIFYAYL